MPTERERLALWKNRIGWSRKKREPFIESYDVYKSYYTGDGQYNVLAQTALPEVLVINLIFSHIKATLPMVYFQNPHFYARPTRQEFKNSAELAENVLNYIVRMEKLKREVRLATLDALFWIGVVKTGYAPVFMDNPKKGENITHGIDENGNKMHVIDPNTGQPFIQPDELLKREEFFTKRVSPRNMLFDPDERNFIEDTNWVAEEVIERLDDVKDNEYFKNRKKIKETHFASKELYVSPTETEYVNDDMKRVRMVHIYDFDNDKFMIYADGQDDEEIGFAYEDDTPDGINKHPYSVLKFHEIPDEWNPLSEIKILKPIQDENNKAVAMLMVHAKKFLRKYLYETGTFSNEMEKEKLLEPVDGMMVEVNVGKTDKVVPVPDAQMDQAFFAHFAQLEKAFWKTAGRTEQEIGEVQRRKTMFESSQIEKYGRLRSQDAMSLVEDWMKDIGKKKLDQLQGNLRMPVAVQIAGPMGQQWIEGLTRDEIQGDMDITVDIGSTSPKIPEFEKAQLMEFLQTMSSIPGIEQILEMPVDKSIHVVDLISELSKKYEIDETNFIKPRTQPPTPNPEMLKTLMQQNKGSGNLQPKKPRKPNANL